MKILTRLDNYLNEREYKIVIKENYINIVNYDEIIDFSLSKILVRYKNKVITIEGNKLVISKMINSEVLITGQMNTISINEHI